MALLLTLRGSKTGTRYTLQGDRCLLGRSPDCDVYDLFVDSPRVSRRHSKITAQNGEFYIADLGSRNGTLLNGLAVDDESRLHDGDRIQIGEFEFCFYISGLTATDIRRGAMTAPATSAASVVEDETPSLILSRAAVGKSVQLDPTTVTVSADAKLRALVELMNTLGGSLDIETMLSGVLDALFSIFPRADRGFIALLDDGGTLTPLAVKRRAGHGDAPAIAVSHTIIESVVKSKEALLSGDATSDERFEASQSVNGCEIRSIMCAPLLDAHERPVGVVQIDATGNSHCFLPADLEILASVAGPVAVAIRYGQLHEQSLNRRLLDHDLEMARRIQFALLPETPPALENYRLFAHYNAAWEVGGDSYDYLPLADGRLAVLLADAAGKGVSASLLAARLSGELRTCLSIEPSPGRAIARVNESLATGTLAGRFVTLVLAVVDPVANRVELVNAGHPAPLLRRADGHVEEVGGERGLPLGVVTSARYESTSIPLAAGEHLAIFTDGFTEAKQSTRERYGIDRLKASLSAGGGGVEESGRQILADLRAFVGAHAQSDDMCLVVLGRVEEVG